MGTKLYPDAGAHHPPGNTYTPRHHLLGMIVAVLKLQLLNLNARHLLALKQQYLALSLFVTKLKSEKVRRNS